MDKQQDYIYDAFISYSHSDRSWVRGELLPRLEASGLRVCIDFRDFAPGAPVLTEMERAIQTSRKTVLVLTPDYLESAWAEFESLVLQTLDPASRDRRLIPLLKSSCDLPARIRYLISLDFTPAESRDCAWAQLLTALGAPMPQKGLPRTSTDRYPSHREDWGEAIDVGAFYGRGKELAELERWIITDRCRLVGVFGMGGIGKTSLTVKLAEQVKNQFDYLFWRDLRNAPPFEDIVGDCIRFLSDQQRIDLPESLDKKISLLIEYLRKHRCLLVLDNVEPILRGGERAGYYREGYEGYGRLIQRVGQTSHQSCLVLTSREKPKEFAPLESEESPTRSLQLGGLGVAEGQKLLEHTGLFGKKEVWVALIGRCAGNPLALKLVCEPIWDLFGGDIEALLDKGGIAVGDIRDILTQQYSRLSELEREIIHWLAIAREAVSLEDLQKDLLQQASAQNLLGALESLRRRSLIECSGGAHFTLQPVVMEYLTHRLIEQVIQEINAEAVTILTRYALIKAQSKDYIRESQIRLILEPVTDRLLAMLGMEGIEQKLGKILLALREEALAPGYAAGNILNILVRLGADLSGRDFSKLTVWQAYLRNVHLHDLSFAHSSLAKSVFLDTFGSILSLAVSPNGKLLAAGTNNDEIRVWSMPDCEQPLLLKGHSEWVNSVAFGPDSNTLASGSGDWTIKLWDINTGQCLKTLEGHTHRVISVSISPNGTTLASGSSDHTVRLWNIDSGQCIKTLQGHTQLVRSVAFSPDCRTLASGSSDQTLMMWEVRTGQCLKVLRGHTAPVTAVAFSPDGCALASGSNDQTIRLWNVETGQCQAILQGHAGSVWSIALSPDGNSLASGSDDKTVRLWDINTGRCRNTMQGHTSWIWALAFTPDAQVLVSGGNDQVIRLWDARTGQRARNLRGYANPVWSVVFSPDGRLLASGSEDCVARLWDVESGKCLETMQGHTNRIRQVAFSPDGTVLASCGEDRTVRLWDIPVCKCLAVLRGHTEWLRSVAFSPDGHTLASGGYDQIVLLWDVSTGQSITALQGHESRINSVAFNPDGDVLASGSDDQTVRLWDVNTKQCLKVLQGHRNSIRAVAFSPDGHTIVTCGDDQTVQLWNASTGRCLKIMQGHTNRVRDVAVSHNGDILASGSDDSTVRLWSVETGRCLKILEGHTRRVRSVAFSNCGNMLASGSHDETIRLWDVQTGRCLRTLAADRPYERMNITGTTGLTETQKATLKALGAVER